MAAKDCSLLSSCSSTCLAMALHEMTSSAVFRHSTSFQPGSSAYCAINLHLMGPLLKLLSHHACLTFSMRNQFCNLRAGVPCHAGSAVRRSRSCGESATAGAKKSDRARFVSHAPARALCEDNSRGACACRQPVVISHYIASLDWPARIMCVKRRACRCLYSSQCKPPSLQAGETPGSHLAHACRGELFPGTIMSYSAPRGSSDTVVDCAINGYLRRFATRLALRAQDRKWSWADRKPILESRWLRQIARRNL